MHFTIFLLTEGSLKSKDNIMLISSLCFIHLYSCKQPVPNFHLLPNLSIFYIFETHDFPVYVQGRNELRNYAF